MRYLLIAIICFPSLLAGQSTSSKKTDSLGYYMQELTRMRGRMMDSLMRSDEYRFMSQRLEYHRSQSDNYSSFNVSLELLGVKADNFNQSITTKGFKSWEGRPITRLGIGWSSKRGRIITDLGLGIFGFNIKSNKGGEKIYGNVSSVGQIDVGYDFIKSKNFNLYPYAGLALRMSSIEYRKPATVNASFSDISDIIQNNQSVFEECVRFGYQAGLGMDIVVDGHSRPGRKPNVGGIIFFMKGGINRIIGKETYNIEGIKYRPGIVYGQWAATFGIKLFGRD